MADQGLPLRLHMLHAQLVQPVKCLYKLFIRPDKPGAESNEETLWPYSLPGEMFYRWQLDLCKRWQTRCVCVCVCVSKPGMLRGALFLHKHKAPHAFGRGRVVWTAKQTHVRPRCAASHVKFTLTITCLAGGIGLENQVLPRQHAP